VQADCFREVYRLLKPGGLFAVYEWAMTPLYDPNVRHRGRRAASHAAPACSRPIAR